MTDLDQRITSVLREHAEGETDTHRLLRASRTLGRRRQVRRRAATGTALALVGVLGFVGVTSTDLGGLSGRLPWVASTPTVAAPVPPRADGVPGAAERPDLVGSDPSTLHFGLDPGRARYLRWAVYGAPQVESIRFSVGGGQPILVEVSHSAQVIKEMPIDGFPAQAVATGAAVDGTIRPVPGTSGGLLKAWEPVPGLYARASTLGGDQGALSAAVEAVRWNEARRCAGPLRLTKLPEGTRVATCSVEVTAFPKGLNVELTLVREPSATMWVRLVYGSEIAITRDQGNRTVAGHPAYLYPDGTKLDRLDIPRAHLTADFGWPYPGTEPPEGPGFTEAEATTVLAGAQVPKDLTDPETWR
ncbi:hypothetical protein ACIBPB_22175 [Micromonospora sp. NPDC049836]|uniref:hypothetical protein n=1 Tax=Micromonospora sp. NPDC049836 TaxID=3364274 RepID=UPI0037BCC3D5